MSLRLARASLSAVVAATLTCGCGELMQQVANNPGARAALGRGVTRAAAAQLPVGDDEERAYGGAVAVHIIARHGGLVEDEALHRYVGSVGLALAGTSSRPALKWHFGVLASDVPNAWSAPGGYVFVTRGLLRRMRDEAELAGVLGHEIAHVTRRHAVAIFQNLKSAEALSSAAADAWRAPTDFSRLIDRYVEDYLSNGMPRDKEFEADGDGVNLAAGIGYRGASLAELLERLRSEAAAPGASSHPDLLERAKRLRALAPAAQGAVTNQARFATAMRSAQLL